MKFHLGFWSVAAAALVSLALVGCNPPVDENKKEAPAPGDVTKPMPSPATAPPAEPDKTAPDTTKATPEVTKPAEPTPIPEVTKPGEPTPAPKDENKKEEPK